jgi:hypothetical protein
MEPRAVNLERHNCSTSLHAFRVRQLRKEEEMRHEREPQNEDKERLTERPIDRRKVLATAGSLAALAAMWQPASAFAADDDDDERRKGDLVLDVALLGDTFAPDMGAALDAGAGDLRGVGFFVEGLIYPSGTIPPGPGFDPASEEAFGTWLCRGWLMLHSGRPEPHAITTQEHVLGIITPSNPTPRDQLVSSGPEGGVPRAVRSILGGTGRYRRARGEVVQHLIGTNTTVLNVLGMPGPNLRFVFEL